MGRVRTHYLLLLTAIVLVAVGTSTHLRAGELRVRIPVFTAYVGQEMVVPLNLENINTQFSISNIRGPMNVEKGINPVKVVDIGPYDLAPGEKKELMIETGYTPDQAGWMEVRTWLEGDDNINGEVYFVQSVQIKDAPPCPERPSREWHHDLSERGIIRQCDLFRQSSGVLLQNPGDRYVWKARDRRLRTAGMD